MKQDKHIKVEGPEIILRNKAGDTVVIPKKHRVKVLQMIQGGNHSAIDDIVSELPVSSDYAEDGSVIPSTPESDPKQKNGWLTRLMGKKKDLQVQPEAPVEKKTFNPTPGLTPKDDYTYHKNKFFSNPELRKLDDEGKKKALNGFYDGYGVAYLKSIGIDDDETLKDYREKFIQENISLLSGVPKKKVEPVNPEEKTELVVPDWLKDRKFSYEPFYAKQDNLQPPMGSDAFIENGKQVQAHQEEFAKQIPEIQDRLLNTPEFGYLKTSPQYFMQRGEESIKEVDKWLKSNTELSYVDRADFIQNLTNKSEKDWVANLRKGKDPQQLKDEITEAAEPFITDAEPGTFLDPVTGKRKNAPVTDDDAEYASLIQKFSSEMMAGALSTDVQNPIYKEKEVIETEHVEMGKSVESLTAMKSEIDKIKGDNEERKAKVDEYNKAYDEYVSKLDSFNMKVDEFNKKANKEQPAGILEKNQTAKQKIEDRAEDAYLKMQYWQDTVDGITNQMTGREPALSLEGLAKSKKDAVLLLRNAKAEFEAATRILYNNEGPLDVEKDAGYMAEVFGSSFLKAVYGDKSNVYEGITNQEILGKMNSIMAQEDIELTEDEANYIDDTVLESVVSTTASLIPALPELILLGQASRIASRALTAGWVDKMTRGYKIIKNPVLKSEGKALKQVIGYKDPVPVGWEVLKEFNPTNAQKAQALIAKTVVDEMVFTGVGGFDPGAMTGMNASHLLLPDIKFKGRLQAFNPIVDAMWKSGIGATVGMEAGGITAGIGQTLISDKPLSVVLNELFPSAEESAKRVFAETVANSLLFGGMSMVSTGIAKQTTAPIGVNKTPFGNANWYAYFSPVYRDKIYKAGKQFEDAGYPDAAKYMYGWLDITKDPVSAQQIKEVRSQEYEERANILPIGTVREVRDLHEKAIETLETQSRQPEFDGTLDLPLRNYSDLKLGSVVGVSEPVEGKESTAKKHYEITGIETYKNTGRPIKFETVDVETGEKRVFDINGEGKFDFDPSAKYKLNHPLEIHQRLEIHYDALRILDKVIAKRGRYSEQFILKEGPKPKESLPPSSGEVFEPPLKPSKIEKKMEEISRREKEMMDEGGEPIELPKELKKKYSFGDQDTIMTTTAREFADNITARSEQVKTSYNELDKQEGELKKRLDAEFKGRLTTEQRNERSELQNEIKRTELAKDRLNANFDKEVGDFWEEIRPQLVDDIKTIDPEINDEDLENVLENVWNMITGPTPEEEGKSVSELLKMAVGKPSKKADEIKPSDSETKGKKLSKFKEGDRVYRDYNGRREEYEIVSTKKDIWKLKNNEGVESDWNAANNGGFIKIGDKKDPDKHIAPMPEKDVLGNPIMSIEEWRDLPDDQKPEQKTITKEVTDPKGNKFPVDYNLAPTLEKIWNLGYQTGQSDSGTKSDHPFKRYVSGPHIGEIIPGGGYMTFWKPEASSIQEAGRDINTQEQIDNIRRSATKAGFIVEDTQVFFQPSLRINPPQTKSGLDYHEINNEAIKIANEKFPGLHDENFDKYLEEKDKIFYDLRKEKGYLPDLTDQDVIDYWNKFTDELEKLTKKEPVDEDLIPPEERELPDISSDAEKMRDKGFRLYEGVKYIRQQPIESMVIGSDVVVRFTKKTAPKGSYAIIEANQLQPSHKSGYVNPMHFIPEAQPRNRGNLISLANEAKEKAQNLDPSQLYASAIAYTGAPVVNDRGEVIQGNGRAEAILYYYDVTANDPKGYVDFMKNHAHEIGLLPEDFDNFTNPVVVRMINETDQEVIKYGNFSMKDLEDVAEGTSSIKQASNRLNHEQGTVISNILLIKNSADDTLNDLIRKNYSDLLAKLTEYEVFSQGDAEKFVNADGITPEGIQAIENVIKGLFFKGGDSDLAENFIKLPYTARTGIEKSIPILLRLPDDLSLLPSVRNALSGLRAYDIHVTSTGETNINSWADTTNMFLPQDANTPRKIFTPFEIALIDKLYKAKTQTTIVSLFTRYEQLAKGKEKDLFDPSVPGKGREEAAKEIFGAPYTKTIDDEYEKAIPGPKGDGGPKKVDKEQGAKKEDIKPVQDSGIKDDLDKMKDLLKDLDIDMGDAQGAGGEGDISAKTKMITIATGMVEKLAGAGHTSFDGMISQILPALNNIQVLKKLLPFIKQAYTGYWATAPQEISEKMDLLSARAFTEEDIDRVIAKMDEPKNEPDTFADVVGKNFYTPDTKLMFKVIRVDEWTYPIDRNIEILGGEFGKFPENMDNIKMAIVEKETGGGKKGIVLSNLREMIKGGRVQEIPETPKEEIIPQPVNEIEKLQAEIEKTKQALTESTKETADDIRAKGVVLTIKNAILNKIDIPDKRALEKIGLDWGITNGGIVRELAEVAMIGISKDIIKDSKLSEREKYSRLLNLYEDSPALTYRSDVIKELQQYSTPTPISYVMGLFTNAKDVDFVLDPQGGNGSLVIGAKTGSVRVNEIDDTRASNLRLQGYNVVTKDSVNGVSELFDVERFPTIHMNPPFLKDLSQKIDEYPLKGEYVIVANTLNKNLHDYGKAGIIVGGHIDFNPSGQMGGKDLMFFNWLHKFYNVVDIIQIPGEFYRKMGASYPIKLILVDGRKVVPQGAAPLKSDMFDPIVTWQDLFDRVEKVITKPNDKSILQSKMDAQRGNVPIVGMPDEPVKPSKDGPGIRRIDEGEVNPPIGEGVPKGEDITPGRPIEPGTGRTPGKPGRTGAFKPTIPNPIRDTPKKGGGEIGDPGREIEPQRDPGDLPVSDIGKPSERVRGDLNMSERTGDEVTPYVPLSRIKSGNYVIPASIAIEVEDALKRLQDEVGDIDQYVMDKLKYNSLAELESFYFAEQVDGIAQAIYNIELGDAMIIGHQTGTGKGRIAAGAIRYAVKSGKLPVFITKNAELFTDIYRDLVETGSGALKPFIVNSKFSDGNEIVRIFHPNTGEVVYEVDEKETARAIQTQKLPEGYDFVLVTYSQFTTEGRDDKRRDFLRSLNLSHDVVFVTDESHQASGASNTGAFFMDYMESTLGGVFLSATYAKRPDNMPIYAIKTVMRETNMDIDMVVEAIKKGGPALQEIITLQLAEAGQFSRIGFKMDAEMNYLIMGDDDPLQRTYNPELGKEMVRKFDESTAILREIIRFQDMWVTPLLKAMNEQIKKEGKRVGETKGTTMAGIKNSPYFSRVWNIIDQLILSIKVKEAIPLLIEDLEAGRKPVIALRNTMEAMFKHMVDDGSLEKGMEIPLDFAHVFMKGMETVMKYTEKDETGKPAYKIIDVTDLPEGGRREYYRIRDKIKSLSTGIPISPIDVLRKGITDRGFKVVEITGRGTMFELNDDMTRGTFVNNDKSGKIHGVKEFNNNPGYLAILNVAGSTGISMHSSPKFKDVSQRSMYILQNDLDINVVVQILGRVYRADQINKPIYNILTSMLPAEKRLFMMNAKKLKSLDANTSGNQKQSKNLVDVPDFLNKYGDEVVVQYLLEHPDINEAIGDPLNLNGKKEDRITENAAHKITGRMQILPSEQQNEFNDEVIENYEQVIDYLNSTGKNDLMVTSELLDAEIKKSEVVIKGNGGYSAFGDDTNLVTAEVNVLKKPFTKKELDEILSTVPETHAGQVTTDMRKSIEDRVNAQISKIREDYEAKRQAKKEEALKRPGTDIDKQRWLDDEIEMLDDHENFRITTIDSKANDDISLFKKYLNFFFPGRVVEVPFTESDQLDMVRMNKGVFISFDVNKNKPNPYIPSNFILKFATTDSRRVIRIPASKYNHIDSIIGNSYHLNQRMGDEILNNWDTHKSSRTRETRYIITGNILQGFGMFEKGRLIQFTLKGGGISKGILMPENWIRPDKDVVRMPINKAVSIIKSMKVNDFLTDTTGDVTIRKVDWTKYELRVPESTKRGSKYYTNPELKSIVDNRGGVHFEKSGSEMVGKFTDDRMQQIVDTLYNKFKTTVEVGSMKVGSAMDQTSAQGLFDKYRATPSPPKTEEGQYNPDSEPLGMGGSDEYNASGTTKRIQPLPIVGQKPKEIWEIQRDLSLGLGIDLNYSRKPSGKGKAIGAYWPSIQRLGVKWLEDLNTVAHEFGHFVDDIFGLVGPEAQYDLNSFRNELMDLAPMGSNPPKGHTNPEQYKLMEGVAEFFRAWIVNPVETAATYPNFYTWFKHRIQNETGKQISPNAWEIISQFSTDVRTWYGSTAGDQVLSKIHMESLPEEDIPWIEKQRREDPYGNFQITPFDRLSRKWLNMLNPLEESYKWLMRLKGIDVKDPSQLKPSENFEILVRTHLGLNTKLRNVLEKGLVSFDLKREIDTVTKQPIAVHWILESLPNASWKEMMPNLMEAVKYNMAERIVEIPWKIQAWQIGKDIAEAKRNKLYKLPPLEILKLHPYRSSKFAAYITHVLDLIEKGELNPEDVFLPEDRYDFTGMVIAGIAQEGMTDYNIAKAAVAEYEDMKNSNPQKYKWISEFGRRYRQYGSKLMELAHDSGLISDEAFEQIGAENMFYMSMNRISMLNPLDPIDGKESGFDLFEPSRGVSKGLSPKQAIFPIKGSRKVIRNPVESLIQSTFTIYEMADMNYIVGTYAKALNSGRESYDEKPSRSASIAWISKIPEPHSIQFWVYGEKAWLAFRDPEIYAAWKDILPTSTGPASDMMKALGFAPQLLRKAIVISPPFVARNILKDFQSWLTIGIAKRYFRLRDLLNDPDVGDLFELSGAGQFGWVQTGKKGLKRAFNDALFKATSDPKKWVLNPERTASRTADILFGWLKDSERVTRVKLQFKSAYREGVEKYGMNHMDATLYAAYHTRDLMDFAVGGTMAKELNRIFVFSNPDIQGKRKVFRYAKEHPGSFAAALFAFSIMPGIMNSILVSIFGSEQDQKEYVNHPDYIRDMYYRMPFNGGWLLIPKPFDIGFIGSIAQRGADRIIHNDKRAFGDKFSARVFDMLFPYSIPGVTGGYSGFLHASKGNYDYFRQRNIIPPSEQDLSVELRNTEKASKFGKAIQKASGFFNDGAPTIDARKVDAFIEGQLGYVGDYSLKLFEMIMSGESQKNYLFDITDTGLFKRSPMYESPNVQYILKTFKQHNYLQKLEYYKLFNSMISLYFSEEVYSNPKLRDDMGYYILRTAEEFRNEFEGINLNDPDKAMKQLKLAKQNRN